MQGVTLTDHLDSSQKADMRAYMSLVSNVLGNAEVRNDAVWNILKGIERDLIEKEMQFKLRMRITSSFRGESGLFKKGLTFN